MNVELNSPRSMEWAVVTAALLGGSAVTMVGYSYGVTTDSGVGAGFLPVAAGAAIVLAAVGWGAQLLATAPAAARDTATTDDTAAFTSPVVALLEDDNEEDGSQDFPDGAGWRRIAVVIGSIAVAAALLPLLGYSVAMTLMLVAVLVVVGGRRPLVAVAVAMATTAATRIVFDVWLGTSLPTSMIAVLANWGL